MGKSERVFFFVVSVIALSFVTLGWQGQLFPSGPVPVLIYSALLMMSVSSLFLENYFTRPSDVIASGIAALLAIAPLRQELVEMGRLYDAYFIYVLVNVVLALAALLLLNPTEEKESAKNEFASLLFRISTKFGNGKVVFLFLFLIAAISYVDSDSFNFLILIFYAGAVLAINPKRSLLFSAADGAARGNEIGEVIGVQSTNTFLVKLFKERAATRRFDVVEFRYAIGSTVHLYKGVVVDNYLLNEKQWAVVLTNDELKSELGDSPQNDIKRDNVLYICSQEETPKFLERFVGTVTEDSNIQSIQFEYRSRVPIEEGSLLSVDVRGQEILYQIIQGVTKVEQLESKDETALILGRAAQLGQWNSQTLSFDRYGWLPNVNATVFKAGDVANYKISEGESLIGTIPGANFPVLLNREVSVTHHTAILGVTGTGKSVLARHLISKVIDDGTKVICVDLTGEYSEKLGHLKPVPIVGVEELKHIRIAVEAYAEEMAEYQNKRNKKRMGEALGVLKLHFIKSIQDFLTSDSMIGTFELPGLTNTSAGLHYTRWFFHYLFELAKSEVDRKRINIVIEEAHTIIPETNMAGVSDRSTTTLVNNIAQIALQGRKYEIGFTIIAQRTANVSKTVLTQCNTIIAFQQFDKTSAEFLSFYLGSEYVQVLRTLRPRQAVAIGKAFRSGAPVIFEVPELNT